MKEKLSLLILEKNTSLSNFSYGVNLMGLHIAGAIYHRLQGDGVWSAMVPILKEEPDK